MKLELHSFKHKVLTTLTVTVISYLGFEVLSFIIGRTYQPRDYFRVAIYLFLFHLFWLTMMFDVHVKKKDILAGLADSHKGILLLKKALYNRLSHLMNWHYLRHYLNFLILPSVIFWAMVIVMYLNPFRADIKQFVIVCSTASLGAIYWYLKDIYSSNFELHHLGVRFLTLAKVYAAFLFYSAIIGFSMYFGLGWVSVFIYVFIVTFLLIYQALFQHKYPLARTALIVFGISFVMALCSSLVYVSWNHLYLTAGLLLAAVYNAFWGLFHHHLDGNLSKKMAVEYLFFLILVTALILGTHDFTPRINP